ncbi:hypothetical protein C0J52_06897 [Blattella germanica]|nr:hypothetical protein C0J52_06897 [Blattella germanica]
MKKKEIEDIFGGILEKEQDVSAGMAAIRTLLTVLEHDTSETVQELDSNLQAAVDAMKNTDYPVTAVASGCELFLRFITLAKLDTKTFGECKNIMLHRGRLFLKKLMEARGKVAKLAAAFIVDGSRVLTHSKSRVVLHAMKEAARANKRFEVFVTISSPDSSGCVSSYICESENGRKLHYGYYTSTKLGRDLSKEHPLVDYTPPSYITLLFTDLGILTPSAVSDELIKLYL